MKYILSIFALLCTFALSAQNLPERGEVRGGNRDYNKGKYAEAVEHYKKAIGYSPSLYEATYNLGNALYESEQYENAEKSLMAAAADSLRSDIDRSQALYNLGNAQFKQNKYKEALESYKRSILLNPEDKEAKYNYAYTKQLLDEQENQQNQDQQNQDQQNQDQNQDENQDQNQDQQSQNQDNQDQNNDSQDDKGDEQQDEQNQPEQQDEQQGDDVEQQQHPQPQEGRISEQEQQQILNAIQAQEDKTQDKLKEQGKGIVIPGRKNW